MTDLRLPRRSVSEVGLIAVAAVGLWYVIRTITLVLPTWHVDGAFQTASALFRLDSGQFPGRDFLPYLGLTTVYVPYLPFKAAGSDLAASATAAYFVIMAASAGTIALVMRLIAPKIPSARVLAVALIVVPLALGAAKGGFLGRAMYEIILGQAEPGNSMRPLRSFAPYLSAALLLLVMARVRAPHVRSLCFGAIGGGILWWSNDYGPPAAAMAALVMAIDLTRNGRWTVANVVAGGAGAGAMFAATVTLLTAGHPLPFLDYLVNGVGRDQWWYYGPWLDGRLFTPADFGILVTPPHIFAAAVLAVFSVRVARTRDPGEAMLALIGWAVLAGGLIAFAGGHLEPGYFSAIRWWAALVFAGYAVKWIWSRLETGRVGAFVARHGTRALGAVVLLYAGTGIAAYAWRGDRLSRDPAMYREAGLGGFLPIEWRAYMARADTPRQGFVEEYWGLWSALRRQNLGRVDSTIHALGNERAAFAGLIEAKPPLVVSSRPWATWGYQGWSLSANWWFWGPLLRDYRIDIVAPKTFLWVRAKQPDWTPAPCRVSTDRKRIFIDGPGEFFEVRIAYRVLPAPRRLLMAQNGLGKQDGWFPLDPAGTTARFPVLLDARARQTGISFMTLPAHAGEPRVTLGPTCVAMRIAVTPDVWATLPVPSDALGGYPAESSRPGSPLSMR